MLNFTQERMVKPQQPQGKIVQYNRRPNEEVYLIEVVAGRAFRVAGEAAIRDRPFLELGAYAIKMTSDQQIWTFKMANNGNFSDAHDSFHICNPVKDKNWADVILKEFDAFLRVQSSAVRELLQ